MNCIKRPYNFLVYSKEWYLNEIRNLNPEFDINKQDINIIIKNITKNSKFSDDIINNFLYLIYNMLLNNDFQNPIKYGFGGIPKRWI